MEKHLMLEIIKNKTIKLKKTLLITFALIGVAWFCVNKLNDFLPTFIPPYIAEFKNIAFGIVVISGVILTTIKMINEKFKTEPYTILLAIISIIGIFSKVPVKPEKEVIDNFVKALYIQSLNVNEHQKNIIASQIILSSKDPFERGVVEFFNKDFEKALGLFSQYIENANLNSIEYPEVLYFMGMALYHLDRVSEATKYFDSIKKVKPLFEPIIERELSSIVHTNKNVRTQLDSFTDENSDVEEDPANLPSNETEKFSVGYNIKEPKKLNSTDNYIEKYQVFKEGYSSFSKEDYKLQGEINNATFEETYKDTVKLSSKVHIGYQFSQPQKIDSINILFPHEFTGKACVDISSIDGRYHAYADYDIPLPVSGTYKMSFPSAYKQELNAYTANEISILARLGSSCKSSTTKVAIASWGDIPSTDNPTILIQSYYSEDTVHVPNLKRAFRCKKIESKRKVIFHKACELNGIDVRKISSIIIKQTDLRDIEIETVY